MAHEHHILMLLTDAAAYRADPAALDRYTPRLAALAERDGHRLYAAIAERASAVARRLDGDYAAAARHLDRAIETFSALGTTWQLARTLVFRAELAQLRQDPEAARAHYAQALAAYESLHAQPDLERTRRALAEAAP